MLTIRIQMFHPRIPGLWLHQACIQQCILLITDLGTKYGDHGEVFDAQPLPPITISANTFEG